MTARHTRHFLAAVVDADSFALRLVGGGPVAVAAAIAGDSASRRRGLLGRSCLADGEALVVAPTQGVHTFGMRFAIDVVFVDASGRVLKIAATVPPRRVRFCWRAFAAIELPAGSAQRVGLEEGSAVVAGIEGPQK